MLAFPVVRERYCRIVPFFCLSHSKVQNRSALYAAVQIRNVQFYDRVEQWN